MIAKLLLSILLLFFSLLARAESGAETLQGVWADSPAGHCFSTLRDYLVQTYGENYSEDESIVVRPVVINGKKSSSKFWVADTTPGINYTQVLFEVKGRDGRACAVLYAPYSTTFDVNFGRDGSFPPTAMIEDAPPPGLKGNRIIFKFSPQKHAYVPEKCFRFTVEEGKSEQINCSEAFQ